MLVLVVGPSGAGKDTLLGGARAMLAGDPRIRFAQRVITRAPQPGGEDNRELDPASFQQWHAAGRFALSWDAHGLRYGIEAALTQDAASGQVVVASVSRTVIAEAARAGAVLVVEITAPAATLARRLAARGREDEAAIAARLARTPPIPPGIGLVRIDNDGTVEDGSRTLADILLSCADGDQTDRAVETRPRPRT